MNVVISVLCVVVMTAVSCSGQALNCYQCTLGFWDKCVATKTNCSVGDRCFVGTGKAASVVDVKVMGCLPKEQCNKTTTVEFPKNKTLYTITRSCCNENYCNAGKASSTVLLPSFTLITLTIAYTMGLF